MRAAHTVRPVRFRLGAALALVTFFTACADQPEPTATSLAPQASSQDLGDVIAAQNRHTPELMQRDGIVGTGVRVGQGDPSIVVYAVSPSHAAAARIPSRLDGYDVSVVVTGRIDANDYNNPQTKERPAPNGFSVGHPAITAGTIGAKVSDGTNTYILSNNHVLANSNAANIGDATLQPGPYDGGTSADQIGTLADFETIVMGGASNTMDAAIARVPNGSDLAGGTPTWAYGAPGTAVYSGNLLNKGVQKFGRTTGHTTGTVTETNVTVSVCYVPRGMFSCAEAATFTGQIGISPGSFSAGGDSGSLIVTNDAGKDLVGLLFAGSSTRTLANPIGPVLQRFGVSIDVSGGGSEPPTDAAPNAAFAVSCNGLTCSFTDQSTDDNGISARAWNFGNGQTSTATNPSTTYAGAGSYTVTLNVTDTIGQVDSASRVINCSKKGKNIKCS
jgi:hypothetical protein